MESSRKRFFLVLTLFVLFSAVVADRCDHLFRSSEAKEAYNKRVVLQYYKEAFTNPQNVATADEKFVTPDGFIQHAPNVADGREALIAFQQSITGTATRSPIDFIAKIAADGDLVWVHELDSNPLDPTQKTVIVHIYRLDCGIFVEHWDVVQPVDPNATYANAHPFF